MNDGTKTTFPELENGATFYREHDGRNLTYQKLDPYKAQVTHDPKVELVGCVFSMAGDWPITTGPSPECRGIGKVRPSGDREIHDARQTKLEADYRYWNDQYAKRPDMIAAAMREANQNALYATKRILALLNSGRAETRETTTVQGS